MSEIDKSIEEVTKKIDMLDKVIDAYLNTKKLSLDVELIEFFIDHFEDVYKRINKKDSSSSSFNIFKNKGKELSDLLKKMLLNLEFLKYRQNKDIKEVEEILEGKRV